MIIITIAGYQVLNGRKSRGFIRRNYSIILAVASIVILLNAWI